MADGLIKNPFKKKNQQSAGARQLAADPTLGGRIRAPISDTIRLNTAVTKEKGRLVKAYPGLGSAGDYYQVAKQNVGRNLAGAGAAPAAVPRSPGGGGRGGGGGYGGGGGGGGGPTAAELAQNQLNYLLPLLGSKSYTAQPMTGLRNTVAGATAQDQAAATGAYNALDQWLAQNQSNPYANVQVQRANVGPNYNPYLESQGVAGLNPVTQNPDDAYGAFQNVLSLLGANQLAGNQSRLAESQMGRTFAGQQIGAMDNAFLANIAQQEAAQQAALDAEKRQAAMQLAGLLGQGATAPPDILAQLGLA